MPISGNEEPGIIARQSSNCSVGVPIKKRWFPLVQFSIPQPTTVLAENDSPQKEYSNQSQEPSLSNASVATTSHSVSDANKTLVNKTFSSVEDKEGSDDTNANSVQNNVHLRAVKLEEPNLKICSGRMDNMGSEEKLMFADRSACQKVPRNTELHLAAFPGNIELSLGLKEPLVPALAVQSSDGSFQVSEKSDLASLCLSLSKEKPITQCKSDDNSNNGSSHLHANRSKWDLNTTMDTWEGSVDDATACLGTIAFDRLNDTGNAHDIKSSSCSIGMVGGGVDLGKQILGARDHISQFPISTLTPSELYKSEDSLHVGLSMSCFQSNFSVEHSSPSAKVDLGKVVPSSDLLGGLVSSRKVNSVGSRTVKSEPIEENAKHNFVGENDIPMGLFDVRTLKRELVERCNLEAVNLLNPETSKHRSIKSEPVQEGNQEIRRTVERTSCQSDGKVDTEMLLTPRKLCSSVLHSCSTELTISGDVLSQSEYSTRIKEVKSQEECRSSDVVSEMVSVSVGPECKESNVSDGMADANRAEDLNFDDPETCRLKSMDDLPLASSGNGEGSVSDEEKINISADMLEEDSYASDYESDGYHTLVAPLGTEDGQYAGVDDEYEDGEVREPLVHREIECPIGSVMKEAGDVTHGDCGDKNVCLFGSPGDSSVVKSCTVEKDSQKKYHGETSADHIKECVDIVLREKTDRVVDKDGFLQDSSTIEMVSSEADEKRPINTIQWNPLHQLGDMEVQKVLERQPSTDGATNRSQETLRAAGQAADGNIERIATEGKDDSTLAKTESSPIGDDAAKDSNSGGNRSRIIKLPRASIVSSPVETSSIPVGSFPSQAERERYTGFERERLHARQYRDEMYLDGPPRFVRGRFQDQPQRNFRSSFMRGRGRSSSRLDSMRGDWDNDSEFASEKFNGSVNYRFARRKPAGADAELECNDYIFAPDGAIVGTDRAGRKPYNDEFPSFHHPSSRRRSPAGRDGGARHGIQMVRRMPRNINMTRCVGEDGSDLAGIKHGEKFLRGLPNDILDPVFSHRQPPYEGADGQFVRGSRNFSSIPRRGVPRIRSKSPIRSRMDSSGTWLSPRRRSPDGLDGLPEITNSRSPAIYRIERMRSPDHHFFPEDIVARRHGSPPYMSRPSNNLRDMDTVREHGHPRSIIPNRSPSDRVLPRSTRRLDILDTRERADKDAYFGRPMQSGRLHELGCDGSGDEIRVRGVRHGPVRSFRPPYRDADGENFSYPIEDGPRPFRFCPEADSEFIERSNLRERVSDRRIESRPINTPRRMRIIEEQEGNYRPGGQIWHDNGFDDGSRGKRRRF
ncbi:uncharacterized protein LOC132311986 isoform X2 [Cornus florida]|uniref:uncharacterized protein LOC132311986 isoform X2 n=1 Tax=Cornus florida TaxID=4283 RepID=UPI002896940D|nr:uncharacterized protein LOC132311986 isoform X2 [Cornus florida]